MMFSVSMMASSTTSPKAMASPPMTMMLKVVPVSSMPSPAAIRDTGIALAVMIAARTSKRNTSNTSTTSPAPIARWAEMLVTERST